MNVAKDADTPALLANLAESLTDPVTAEQTLRAILERYKRTFDQFKLETETAMASFRQEVDDLREQFERLKRIRRSINFEESNLGADEDEDTSRPSAPKRKRWGKRSTVRRRRR